MMMINVLVIAQFTLCITLTVSTFVMHRQTRFMLNQETGYARNELITIPLNMHLDEGINGEKFELFAEELKKDPGIKDATLYSSSPSMAFSSGDDPVNWDGKPEGKTVLMNWKSISYDYFQTLGAVLLIQRFETLKLPSESAMAGGIDHKQ